MIDPTASLAGMGTVVLSQLMHRLQFDVFFLVFGFFLFACFIPRHFATHSLLDQIHQHQVARGGASCVEKDRTLLLQANSTIGKYLYESGGHQRKE